MGVTYVSRMQCVQSAIDSMLEDMQKATPNRKVGIVAFNGEVNVIGDGSSPAVSIAGDKLQDYDFLLNNGIQLGQKLFTKPIKDTQKDL